MTLKTSKIIKRKNIEATINTISTKYGIKYHVHIEEKDKNNIYHSIAPSKTFSNKSSALKYAKAYMRKY